MALRRRIKIGSGFTVLFEMYGTYKLVRQVFSAEGESLLALRRRMGEESGFTIPLSEIET